MSLACRQTDVFRHCWISHEQDDSVHSRALDVVRERDKFFGGLGLHPPDELRSQDSLPLVLRSGIRVAIPLAPHS